ncbi:type I-F CRISPR-associated protein Csy3 [Chromatium okenii]|jgi:CRISPR-associated protein Csy3|uniref:type I-F CRISPR-associated protein Csy3 n=1 Tax=Chromatium okenii TaxID=61644 RepID=UPI0026EE202A|nr:type I-F CRISPR-associated protein Csy3 [Chromatium okenii]MBV5311519.1 type I-F CRISPR-associated protein Csy3 [Chromatium okenii]
MAPKTKDSSLQTASVLAFERKLDPSDGLLFSGNWNQRDKVDWTPIVVREKSVRGTISNRLPAKDQDPTKLNAKIENPNLQTIDVATLPADADTLKVRFTLRVLGGTGTPSACNNSDYQTKLLHTVQSYVEANGFDELGRRYAHNLASARFLWRNRLGAEQIVTEVRHLRDGQAIATWNFDSLGFSLRNFDSPVTADLKKLADVIAAGLSGQAHTLLEIIAFVRVGTGQEVYPSQELILDKSGGKKSKTLYSVSGIAGIHSQKIGNALRTIDTWYLAEDMLMPIPIPIAVEPYGSVTSQGKAYRQPKQKVDFYTLFDRWILKDEVPALEQQHFVIANLIRGGVFGDSEKD